MSTSNRINKNSRRSAKVSRDDQGEPMRDDYYDDQEQEQEQPHTNVYTDCTTCGQLDRWCQCDPVYEASLKEIDMEIAAYCLKHEVEVPANRGFEGYKATCDILQKIHEERLLTASMTCEDATPMIDFINQSGSCLFCEAVITVTNCPNTWVSNHLHNCHCNVCAVCTVDKADLLRKCETCSNQYLASDMTIPDCNNCPSCYMKSLCPPVVSQPPKVLWMALLDLVKPITAAPTELDDSSTWAPMACTTEEQGNRLCGACNKRYESIEDEWMCPECSYNMLHTPYKTDKHTCINCNEQFQCVEFEDATGCDCLPIHAQCDSCDEKETMACWAHGTLIMNKPCGCNNESVCNSCAPRMEFPCLSCNIPVFCSAPMICRDCA